MLQHNDVLGEVGLEDLEMIVLAPVVVQVEPLEAHEHVKFDPLPQVAGVVPVGQTCGKINVVSFAHRSNQSVASSYG